MAEENLKRLSSLLVKDMGLDLTWEVTEAFSCQETIRFAFLAEALTAVCKEDRKLGLEAGK